MEELRGRLQRLKLRQQRLMSAIIILHMIFFSPSRELCKIERLGVRSWKDSHRRSKRRPKVRGKQTKRESLDIQSLDIFEKSGLFEDDFEDLYKEIEASLLKPRTGTKKTKRILHPRLRLLLSLQYLRENPLYKLIAEIYHISAWTVGREIKWVIPEIYQRMRRTITWNQPLIADPHFGSVAALDCTPHLRRRVHPGSIEFYRGDLKDYFLSVQAIVTLKGLLLQVDMLIGHNNDQGIFNATKIGQVPHLHLTSDVSCSCFIEKTSSFLAISRIITQGC